MSNVVYTINLISCPSTLFREYSADKLQDDLLQISLQRDQEDSVFLSLAGLKQVGTFHTV